MEKAILGFQKGKKCFHNTVRERINRVAFIQNATPCKRAKFVLQTEKRQPGLSDSSEEIQ